VLWAVFSFRTTRWFQFALVMICSPLSTLSVHYKILYQIHPVLQKSHFPYHIQEFDAYDWVSKVSEASSISILPMDVLEWRQWNIKKLWKAQAHTLPPTERLVWNRGNRSITSLSAATRHMTAKRVVGDTRTITKCTDESRTLAISEPYASGVVIARQLTDWYR
jgi:hypothetical protein